MLAAVRDRAAYANLLLPRLLADRQLTGRDAALATELAYGTLRGQGTYDAVLATCSDRPLEKLDPPVLDVLRLGAHQLLSTRVGAHAAVATSVDLAKSVAGPRVSGYVNAVLRRVATRDLDAWLDIVAPDPATDPDGNLAVRYSHPRWIVAAYRAALGDSAASPLRASGLAEAADPAGGTTTGGLSADADRTTRTGTPGGHDAAATGGPVVTELEAALAAGNARPRVTLAAFPAGPPRDEIMPADAAPGRWSPYAFTLASGDPAPLITSGAAAVQDEGSQLAAIALSRAPSPPGQLRARRAGERWLDMCAGPGGKARLLYGLAARARRTPDRRRAPPAPRRPGPRRAHHRGPQHPRGAARVRGARRRQHQAPLAGRRLRPGPPRRPVLRPRRAAPPPRGPLAQDRGRPRRSSPPCSAPCSAPPWPPSAPAASSPT